MRIEKFTEAMKRVLDDDRTVILTDRELCTLVNHNLPKQDRISFHTFMKWKQPNNPHSVQNKWNIPPELVEDFVQTLEYARVKQKMDLTGNVMDSENKNQWGSTWILERKFEDLKQKPQVQLNSNPTIMIEAGNKEHAALIDGIINGATEDIPHQEVPNDQKKLEE